MNDILNSLNRALNSQGWVFGELWSRIGSPFLWVDGEQQQSGTKFLEGPYGVLQGLAMYYEKYPTLDEVRTVDHEDVVTTIHDQLIKLLQSTGMGDLIEEYQNNVNLTALTRAQDYSFIKKYASELPAQPAHLDLGPGLGTHAIYSLSCLKGGYTGLETSDFFYDVQRYLFRYLATNGFQYYDPIIDETLGKSQAQIKNRIQTAGNEGSLTHLPSWYFQDLPDNSQDLVTATFMLNETAPAGISWLLAHSNRSLKKGGYFYIRDSERLKPNRHQLNYDRVLQEIGFEEVKYLKVENRVDMFGVPRIYQKTKAVSLTFEEFFDRFFGRYAITVHSGEYMQNIENKK
jgi:hypothetical protein